MGPTTQPHIHSFNEFLRKHLNSVIRGTPPQVCGVDKKCHVVLRVTSIAIGYPMQCGEVDPRAKLIPRECRERQVTYSAPMSVTFECSRANSDHLETRTQTGSIPIMVLSNRCHLSGLNEAGLLAAREEDGEIGGYFIINGLEKVLRLIQVPMRNMPLAIRRPAFKGRGSFFTQCANDVRYSILTD